MAAANGHSQHAQLDKHDRLDPADRIPCEERHLEGGLHQPPAAHLCGRQDALLQAGPTRLRPILMTTAALILTMLPLAAKLGDGGKWRAPLAMTVIGGLLTSTILTLVVVPPIYTLVDDLQRIVGRFPAGVRGSSAGRHASVHR
jgi:AcrB/AcrD/AcrF family